MICEKCNSIIPDNSEICIVCQAEEAKLALEKEEAKKHIHVEIQKNKINKMKKNSIFVGMGIGVLLVLALILIIVKANDKNRFLPFYDLKIDMTKEEIIKKYGADCIEIGESVLVYEKYGKEDKSIQVDFDENGEIERIVTDLILDEKQFADFQKEMNSFYGEITIQEMDYFITGEVDHKGYRVSYMYSNNSVVIEMIKS